MIQHEIDVTRHQSMRDGVAVIAATASFCGPDMVRLDDIDGSTARTVRAYRIVLATGTEGTRDPHLPFDGRHIFTSDDILNLDRPPRTLAVVGAGVIGCEYASIFAALGVRVTLIDQRPRLLSSVDAEIVGALCYHLRENRVTLRLGESVESIERTEERSEDGHGSRVRLHLQSGKTIIADKALYSIGRIRLAAPARRTGWPSPNAGLPATRAGGAPSTSIPWRNAIRSRRSTESTASACWPRMRRHPEPGAGPADRPRHSLYSAH